jgi:4-alpha-glucanotransferase
LAYAKEYLRLQEPSQYHWEMLQELWSSPAGLTIVQAQDLLGLGSESRMNTPSTIGQNWKWRAIRGSFDETLQEKLKHVTQMYGRA